MSHINWGKAGREELQRISGKKVEALITELTKEDLLATIMGIPHLCGILLTSSKTNYKGISHHIREKSIREDAINVHIPII